MTSIRPRHVGVFMCIWLVCLTVLAQTVPVEVAEFEPGVPMKTIPIHLMPRSYASRKRTLIKFQPKDSIQLRFIEHEKAEYYGACHHVDMFVELKTDDGNRTIQSLNPFAFQHAVKSISCSGSPNQLNIELSPEYAKQVRHWKIPTRKVFAVVIPHDFVDLKKDAACYTELSAEAKKSTREHPMETVVKLVKTPRFLDAKNPNMLSMIIVKTDVWSEMNRAQSVEIYHKPLEDMVAKVFYKRSTAYEDGPMWDFEHDLAAATQNIASGMTAKNVNANLDRSTVKGYAQASMAWKQTCIKGIFTGKVRCANWGISHSKISGMTQVNQEAQVSVKADSGNIVKRADSDNPDDLLTLTDVDFTTPSFNLMPSIPLLGFSVPGVFDMGANVALTGSVNIEILVRATKDLLVNTGSSTSCPWIIDWNGSLTSIPTVQFGTCTLPHTPKFESDSQSGDSPVSRQTAFVGVGMTVSPSLGMGLKVFGISALSAGISAPISLGINSQWDTASTAKCPANHVELNADGSASLKLNGGFFGFSKSIPLLEGPTLTTPSTCIPRR
ncbi:hypothetical protein BGX27_005841 [Mortierella sp. AM989]|nr:hypothetical protein BGX27_005841 [Mortierella sp. AM989]